MTQIVIFDKDVHNVKDYELLREAVKRLNIRYKGTLAVKKNYVLEESDFGVCDLLNVVSRVRIYKNKVIFEGVNGNVLGVLVKVYRAFSTKVVSMDANLIEKESVANDFAEISIIKKMIAREEKRAKRMAKKV